MFLNENHPRAKAINSFIEDIINKRCTTLQEARNKIATLRYFCNAPRHLFSWNSSRYT